MSNPDTKIRALYPIDAVNYNALMEDGSLARLMWRTESRGPGFFELWDLAFVDKRKASRTASDVCTTCLLPLGDSEIEFLGPEKRVVHLSCPAGATYQGPPIRG